MRGDGKSNKVLRVVSCIALAASLCLMQADITANEQSDSTLNKWSALAELPDWGGTWLPDFDFQRQEYMKNDAPWNPAAAATIQQMLAAKAEGAPYGLFLDCRPLGMPSWILGSHNAMEILFTPGRVTMLDESDGIGCAEYIPTVAKCPKIPSRHTMVTLSVTGKTTHWL